MQLKTPRLRRAPSRLTAGVKRYVHAGDKSHDDKWSGWKERWQGRVNDNQFAHPGNPAEWKEAYYESQLKLEMKARRSVRTWDYLSPTPARLLNLALDDFLPLDARPSHFLGWLGRRTAASAASEEAAAAAAAAAAASATDSNSNDESSSSSQDGPTIRRHPSGDRSLHSLSSNKTLIRRFQEGAAPLLGPPGLGGAPVLRGPPGLQGATPLPQGHHLVYFPPQLSDQELLPDGTDPTHWPGLPFTRRLWAGGAVTFNRGWERELRFNRLLCAMACDESVQHVELHPDHRPQQQQQEETPEDNRYHDGAPPGKVVVTLMRRYSFDGSRGPVITESRNLVFLRDHPPGQDPAPPRRRSWSSSSNGQDVATSTSPLTARRKPEYSFEMTPSRRLLFNFSALSHNAHLIHLDPAHARAEGHRDLLVHGPLTLVLMLSALRAHLGPMGAAVRSIQYRNLAPLYVDEPLRVCVRRVDAVGTDKTTWSVWIETPDGGPAVKATAISYLVDQDMLFDRPRRHRQ